MIAVRVTESPRDGWALLALMCAAVAFTGGIDDGYRSVGVADGYCRIGLSARRQVGDRESKGFFILNHLVADQRDCQGFASKSEPSKVSVPDAAV